MIRGLCPTVAAVSVLLLALATQAQETAVVPSRGAEEIPKDTCILELTLPEGATLTVDDREYGTRRQLTYSGLDPGKTYKSLVQIAFPAGGQQRHHVLIEGGRRVALSCAAPSLGRPALMLPLKHRSDVNCMALSPDGQQMLTGSGDRTVILWDATTGQRLRIFAGHKDEITCVAFGPQGQRVLTAGDETVILWDKVTGKQLNVFDGKARRVISMAVSPTGRHLLTGHNDTNAILWDLKTGKRIRTLTTHTSVGYSAFSPDGRQILTEGNDPAQHDDHPMWLWDVATGRRVQTYRGSSERVCSCAFSPDGRHILTGLDENDDNIIAILWDKATGRKLQTFVGPGNKWDTDSVAFSPDGRYVLTGSFDKPATLWDRVNGKKVRTFEDKSNVVGYHTALFSPNGRAVVVGEDDSIIRWNILTGEELAKHNVTEDIAPLSTSAAFSPDGRQVLTSGRSTTLWDMVKGRRVRTFDGDKFATFSPDGQQVLTVDGMAFLWDAATGETLQGFRGPSVSRALFSPDGRHVLTSGLNTTAVLWDAATGVDLRTFEVSNGYNAAVFSPDGKYVLATHDHCHRAALWETTTGKKVHTFKGHRGDVRCVAFSPDGRYALTGEGSYNSGEVILWDVSTGRELRTFRGYASHVTSVAFSSNGRQVLTGSSDHQVILWDATTGRRLRNFNGHTHGVESVAFSPSGQRIITGARDGRARVWDILSGQELFHLVSLPGEHYYRNREMHWLVTTPEGFFDGSAGGREQVMFRIGGGLNVVPVDRFFQDFYYPGLLAAIWRGERPLPEVEIGGSLPPKVRIVSPEEGGVVEAGHVALEVEVLDQGGGVRGPWLVQNGARVLAPGRTQQQGKTVRRTFDVALVEGENELEFHAASSDGSWESEPAVMTFRYERPLPKPELYLVAVGINRYAQESMNLEFAVADASSMVGLFRQRGPTLYASVHATALLDQQATAPVILQTVRDLGGKARPQDTVVVFLAGHGTVVGRQYCFLPHEFRRQSDELEDDVRTQGLLASDMQDALMTVPALKRMVIFDTGQSGGEVGLTRTARDPFAFRGAVERLSRATGAFMIASAAVSHDAQEVPELAHGVLTYSLLAGLRAADGGPLEDQWIQPTGKDRVADVLDWYGFASTHVPRLTKQYFGRQQEVQHSSSGMSFPVLPVPDSAAPARVAATVDPVPLPQQRPSLVVPGSGQAKLHLVAVGINRYRDEAMNLKYASSDANAMAELFRRRGRRQYGEVVVAKVLDEQATKDGILKGLEKVAQEAQPEDTLVVFLCGHGKMVGQRYYFIPHEFQRQQSGIEEDIRQQGLPADVLGDVLSKVPAGRRLLIFDTCASGGALGISRQGQDPFAFRGAIEKLGQRQAVFTIAASAAGQEAQEIEQLGHGVLAYALLAGLRAVPPGGPLEGLAIQPNSPDGTVDVLEWFSFASGHVPRLTKRYLHREQHVQTSGQGTSFPILPRHE